MAFVHKWPDKQGVYTEIGGVLELVADLGTKIPGGKGFFLPPSGSRAFDEVSISGSSVAFVGRGIEQEGIYSTIGGSLRVEVDLNTVLPGGGGNVTRLRSPSIDGEDLAFFAYGQHSEKHGIYLKQGGTLRVVAATGTLIPESRGASRSSIPTLLSKMGTWSSLAAPALPTLTRESLPSTLVSW